MKKMVPIAMYLSKMYKSQFVLKDMFLNFYI